MSVTHHLTPGQVPVRPAPAGLPDPLIDPPVVAESGDPFAAVRIVHLVAQLERGLPIRLADIADRLNATYLDWHFTPRVVADSVIALRANWMADYRNTSGIVLEDGPYGTTVTIEDSSRVDPWIVRQAQRAADACRERLAVFARQERITGDG